jgi:outer membrane protein assembly factor BamA
MGSRRPSIGAGLVVAALRVPPAPQPSEPEIPFAGPPAEPSNDRTRPDRARKLEHPPPEREDRALAVPRALLAVPRVVVVGVSMPLVMLLGVFDDEALARARRIFFWNRAETIGWRPVGAFQGGYGFAMGARIFHNNLFGHGESLTAEARAGGVFMQAYQLRFKGEHIGGTRLWLDMRGRYDSTPRLVFQGIGNPSRVVAGDDGFAPDGASVRSRYSQTRGLAALAFGASFGPRNREVRPGIGAFFNHRRFGPAHPSQSFFLGQGNPEDPSIEEVYDVDSLTGFRSGVDVVRIDPSLELDFRDHRGQTSRGFTWLTLGGGAPPQARHVAFWHYGTELTGFANLFNKTRVLVMRLGLEAVHGNDKRIPFSELPRLGGAMRLRGYRLNRFRDKRALFGTIEYRYPIHQMLAGFLFVDGGRVGHDYRDLFGAKLSRWHYGFGGGFEMRFRERTVVRIDLSYGEDFLVFFSFDALQGFSERFELEL